MTWPSSSPRGRRAPWGILTGRARRWLGAWGPRWLPPHARPRVLVVGVYLADRENCVDHIVEELGRARAVRVEQRWIAIGGRPETVRLRAVTRRVIRGKAPKFRLLNELLTLEACLAHDYLVLVDDDIRLPPRFLDGLIGLQGRLDFALAQPARTHGSYVDHPIVEQVDGVLARQTRFVEIGPVVSIRQDLMPRLVPFDPMTPMGWGLDFTWPVEVARAGLRMGIIDAAPVEHSLRPPAHQYSAEVAKAEMAAYLAAHEHLTHAQAFVELARWAKPTW